MDRPVLILVDNSVNVIEINSDEFSIGRGLQNSYVMKEICVSRTHCIFTRNENNWFITDKSSNGTKVNSIQLEKNREHILNDQDIIELSDAIKYRFALDPVNDHCYTKRRRLDSDQPIVVEDVAAGAATSNSSQEVQIIDDITINNSLTNISMNMKLDLMREKALSKKLKENSETMETEIANLNIILYNKDTNIVKLEQDNMDLRSNCAELEKEREELQLQLTDFEYETSLLKLEIEKLNASDRNNSQQADDEDQKLVGCVLRAEIIDKESSVKSKINKAVLQYKDFTQKHTDNNDDDDNNASKTIGKHLTEIQSDINELILKRSELETNLWREKNRNSDRVKEDVYSMLDAELQCSICNELFIKATTLNCSHMFCKMCILRWQKQKSTCPICRKPIKGSAQSIAVDNLIDQMIERMLPEKKEIRDKLKESYETVIQGSASSSDSREEDARIAREINQTIYVSSDDDSDTDFEGTIAVDLLDDLDDQDTSSEDDHHYGRYGLCFICGDPTHWANSCPNRRRRR